MIASTIFLLEGTLSDEATRVIKGEVYQVSRVGGISFEVEAGKDTRMILKHKITEPIDRSELETAIAQAGDYRLL